jgi:UDP-3-O-[3-hydroxymyristoyl] glucosamine N-acyltransferase
MKIKSTLKSLADILGAEFVGNPDLPVTGLNEIHVVEEGDMLFVDHPKYYDKALNSKATSILINKKVDCPEGKGLIIVDEPFTSFNILVRHFQPLTYCRQNVSSSATIGENTIIMPGCFIGNHVQIGEDCIIHPNVVVYDHCIIGNGVTIHANTVIGADAFYFKKRKDNFEKLQSCGRVILQDGVEIGASCTIDRGVTGDTQIGKNSKLDNHVHIGHDTVIGEMWLLAAQVGVAGVVTIKNRVTLWGQVGVASDLVINDDVVVYAQSGVGNDLESGKAYFGSPCRDAREVYKEMILVKQLPQLINRIKKED